MEGRKELITEQKTAKTKEFQEESVTRLKDGLDYAYKTWQQKKEREKF